MEMSESKPNNKDIYMDLEVVRKDITEVKQTVYKLAETKQDRVKPAVIIPFILYLIAQAFGGIWWASEISTTQQTILARLADAGQDRFYGRDATAMERYFEAKIAETDATLQSHIQVGQGYMRRVEQNEQKIIQLQTELEYFKHNHTNGMVNGRIVQ